MSAHNTMDAARWRLVQDVLAEVLDLPPEQRDAVIEERCGDDVTVKAEVRSLASAADEADEYFDDLAGRAGITLSMLEDTEVAGEHRMDVSGDPVLDESGPDEATIQAIDEVMRDTFMGTGAMGMPGAPASSAASDTDGGDTLASRALIGRRLGQYQVLEWL